MSLFFFFASSSLHLTNFIITLVMEDVFFFVFYILNVFFTTSILGSLLHLTCGISFFNIILHTGCALCYILYTECLFFITFNIHNFLFVIFCVQNVFFSLHLHKDDSDIERVSPLSEEIEEDISSDDDTRKKEDKTVKPLKIFKPGDTLVLEFQPLPPRSRF